MKFETVPYEEGLRERLKDPDYALGMIDEMAKENSRLRALLRGVLIAQDCEWEQKNLGHDWKDLIAQIREEICATPEQVREALEGK